jgi:hypothetical protein
VSDDDNDGDDNDDDGAASDPEHAAAIRTTGTNTLRRTQRRYPTIVRW